MDARIPRSVVDNVDEFDRLQALHEAGVDYLSQDRLEELTPGMRALTVLFAVTGGIDNGGFSSLMYNSTGRWAGQAITAARLIGAHRHAEVLERFVASALRGDAEMDDDARNARLQEMDDAEAAVLEALDDEFYDLPSIEDALTVYVDSHPDEFFLDTPDA
jgi:Domain of unknown function (DUF4375)